MLGRADARHHILALGIDQILAIELVGAGRRVAGEGDAGCAAVAHVAEHHRLHADGGAPVFGDIVQLAIGDGALRVPAAEDRADGAPELLHRILRERLAQMLLHLGLVAGHHGLPVVGGERRVQAEIAILFVQIEDLLEIMVIDAQHHVAIHLDEAAIAVIGEARIARLRRQAFDGLVVEAEIEHGIHHAGHGDAGARAHGDQQRIGGVAELGADGGFDLRQPGGDLRLQIGRIGFLVGVEIGADLGRDGDARRHRQAQAAHFRQIGALAAQQIAHVRPAIRLPGAKAVDPLGHGPSIPRSARNRRPCSRSCGSATAGAGDWRADPCRRCSR